MLQWVKVLEAEDAETTFIRKVKAGNRSLCMVGFEGKVFAVSAQCPHAGAELVGGWCEDGKIVCPIHRYQYDLETGRGTEGQGDYVETFPVEVREDGIYVQVKKRWSFLSS